MHYSWAALALFSFGVCMVASQDSANNPFWNHDQVAYAPPADGAAAAPSGTSEVSTTTGVAAPTTGVAAPTTGIAASTSAVTAVTVSSPNPSSDAALNTIATSNDIAQSTASSAATTTAEDRFGLPPSGGGAPLPPAALAPEYAPDPVNNYPPQDQSNQQADRRTFDFGGDILTPLAGAAATALSGTSLLSLPNANIQPTLQKTFVLNLGPHNPPLVVQGNAFQPGASAGATVNNAAPLYGKGGGRGGYGARSAPRYGGGQPRPAGPPPVYAQQRGGNNHVSYPSSPSLPQVAGKLGIAHLLNMAKQSGFLDNLLVGGPFTFFAPSDEAFTKLPKIILDRAATRPELMKSLLLYHLVPDTITTRHFTNDLLLPTLNTKKVRINLYQLGYKKIATVNGAVITRADQYIINGVIHVIDRVLFPVANTSILGIINGPNCQPFDIISTVLAIAGLYDKLQEKGPFTVFLPNTESFGLVPEEERNKLLQNQTLIREAFLYHIVPGTYYGQGLQDGQWLDTLSSFGVPIQVGMVSDGNSRRFDSVNGAVRIVTADIPAENGVIHIVDKIITPFQTYLPCLDS